MNTLNASTEEKAIARKIKLFLVEIPDTCTVEEIFQHLAQCEQLSATITHKEEIAKILNTLKFETKEDIAKILRSKYVENTVQTLLCKIAEVDYTTPTTTPANIVWDCSVCNNELSFLKKLFFAKDNDETYVPLHVFLYPTFRELLLLSKSENPETQMHSSNASEVLQWIVEDSRNYYSIAEATTEVSSYIDDTLANYYATNNCTLFTQDCYLTVIARSMGTQVLINFTPSDKEQHFFEYTPIENGKTIIVDMSCLSHLSLQNILDIAESEKCGRFLITQKLAKWFETNKKTFTQLCKEFVHFLIMDTNNEKSFYSDKKDASLGLIELARKYDGFIITSNLETAFNCKIKKIPYHYVAPKEHSITTVATLETVTKPAQTTVKPKEQHVTAAPPTIVEESFIALPRFNSKKSEISFKKSRKHFNVRINVLDNNRKLLTPTNEVVKIQQGYFIIEITRTLAPEEKFTINEITVVSDGETLKGKITYSKEYSKKTFNVVRNDLRGMAEAATLLLSSPT